MNTKINKLFDQLDKIMTPPKVDQLIDQLTTIDNIKCPKCNQEYRIKDWYFPVFKSTNYIFITNYGMCTECRQ